MKSSKMLGFATILIALGFAVSLSSVTAQPTKEAPIKVGMGKAFFHDLPQAFVDIAIAPFGDLMKNTTGLEGKLNTDDQYPEIAQKLEAGTIQLAVFHGHEFAWIQKKYPKFAPLMIATNKEHDVSAYVIVQKDNPAKTIADLRGKKFDLPFGTKEHCRIFLKQNCKDNAQNNLNEFFGKVVNSSSSIDAMDDVARGQADATLVDTIALAFYKSVKGPVFEKNLRVLAEHKNFPSPLIVYRQGNVPEATIMKIRDGMTKAHENPKCKEMFELWQIDAFAPIPQGYTEQLAVTLKAFPSPEAAKVSMR